MSFPPFSLSIKNLQTVFRVNDLFLRAVDGVDLQVKKGEVMGLAGESACGKSTLAYSILRLLPANGEIIGGEIFLNGKNILKLNEEELRKVRWKEISIIFQGAINALNPIMTIKGQIMEAILEHENITEEKAQGKVEELIRKVGITDRFINSYPHELSGGMKQRIMIAMSLACDPSFLIADEITTALDVIVQKKILDLIKDIQKQMDLSMLLISHDLSVIAQTCDRCAIMYAGKIVELADIQPLFHNSLHPYTQALLSAFPDMRSDKNVSGIPGTPPNLIDPPSGCRFHPRCHLFASKRNEICTESEPKLEMKQGHLIACHMVDK